MLNILPFEIISRNTKTLLITYISSVDISHEGMKKNPREPAYPTGYYS